MKDSTNKLRTVAAIELGSSAVHLSIAELNPVGHKVIETLSKRVRLGQESFSRGQIPRSVIDECVGLLKKFKKVCKEYGVKNIRAMATSSVYEASNGDVFLDNIHTFTDLEIEVVSALKEIETLYRALSPSFSNLEDKRALLKVGGGSCLLAIFDAGKILQALVLPLGVVRLKQIFDSQLTSAADFPDFLRATVDHELTKLRDILQSNNIERLYAFGNEAETLRGILNLKADQPTFHKDRLTTLLSQIQDKTALELSENFAVPYEQAESFYPVCYILSRFSTQFCSAPLEISPVSFRDGMLLEMHEQNPKKRDLGRLEKQLHSDAVTIGRSLRFDEKHALTVAKVSLSVFDQTINLHHLGPLERCLLMTAAILHDVGYSISPAAHHKHSYYIILARDFFFLGDEEKMLVALIARYHRKSSPKVSHPEFTRLPTRLRMVVMKLAAILRLAEALDYERRQIIEEIRLNQQGNEIKMQVITQAPLWGERYSFEEKKKMFEELFGVKTTLDISRAGK